MSRISALPRTTTASFVQALLGIVFLHAILLFGLCPSLDAQSPSPAGVAATQKDPGGFTPGWTLGARFEGSTSSEGSIFDLGTAVGRNFSRHFGADLGVPIYFIGIPSSTQQTGNGTTSTPFSSAVGLGAVFSDLRMIFPDPFLNYASTVHLTAPTGDVSKGLSTAHFTWNQVNHIDHAFGDLSPFLDAGVGNTVLDSHYLHRPFITFGYNAQFEGGLEYDPGKFSFSASAYDVAPWGNQTVISRLVGCGKSGSCSSAGASHNRKNYLNSNVTTGGADLVRDNGWNGGVDFKPTTHLDLEFDFSRSVPLGLNSYSFGIGLDLSGLLQRYPH